MITHFNNLLDSVSNYITDASHFGGRTPICAMVLKFIGLTSTSLAIALNCDVTCVKGRRHVCGGIILYIASTDYMDVTIMCLDDDSDYL